MIRSVKSIFWNICNFLIYIYIYIYIFILEYYIICKSRLNKCIHINIYIYIYIYIYMYMYMYVYIYIYLYVYIYIYICTYTSFFVFWLKRMGFSILWPSRVHHAIQRASLYLWSYFHHRFLIFSPEALLHGTPGLLLGK